MVRMAEKIKIQYFTFMCYKFTNSRQIEISQIKGVNIGNLCPWL